MELKAIITAEDKASGTINKVGKRGIDDGH